MKNFKNITRYISIILKNNKAKACIAFLVMLAVSIMELSIPQLSRRILDDAIATGSFNLLIKLILIYGIISIVSSFLTLFLEYIYSKIKKSTSAKLKLQLLKHISKLSGNYFTEIKTGNILKIVESDIYTIENCGIDLFFTLIVNVFTAILAIYFLVQMQLDLFLIIIVLQMMIIFCQSRFTNDIALKTNKVRENAGYISNLLQEYISNIMNVVISKSVLQFFKKLIKNEKKFINKCINLDMTISSSISIANILNDLVTLSIYGYGGFKIIKGQMTIGELIAFQQYTRMLMGPCMSIIRSNTKVQQTAVSIDRVFSILDEFIVIQQNNKGTRFYKNLKGSITFNHVSFSYNDNTKILNDINLKFEAGKITAIVGSSGCGKSTIAKLLFRLWDIDQGSVMIDDIPIQKLNLKALRKNISIITQDLLLFDDTLYNNLTLENKSIRNEYVEQICKYVGMYNFISELPNGFETIVGEKGVKLSGGQKQRISIARELLSDTKIIIFDEATSALDNISQSEILENIKDLLKGKTTIVITHRLSTIKNADKIYVINEMQIVEEGTHEDLINKKGYYYSLLNEQNVF